MKAIVIGAIPYSDSSKIVKVLTRDEGLIPVFVRLGSGKARKKSNALWHPLSAVDLEGFERKNEMGKFNDASRALPANNLLVDPKRTAVAFFLAEVVEKSVKEGGGDVFEIMWEAVMQLEVAENIANLHFYILAKLVDALGLMPENAPEDPHLNSLNLDNGEWSEVMRFGIKKDFHFLEKRLAKTMMEIKGMEFAQMKSLNLQSSDRKELLLAMVMFIQLHHAGLKEIKSYDVLETVFA